MKLVFLIISIIVCYYAYEIYKRNSMKRQILRLLPNEIICLNSFKELCEHCKHMPSEYIEFIIYLLKNRLYTDTLMN